MKWMCAGALCAALLTSGCLDPGPLQRSLIVSAPCQAQAEGEMAFSTKEDAAILAILPLKSSAALDRRAVAIRHGQVMRQATIWTWEDSPRRLVGQALTDRLACSPHWNVVTPYRPRAPHDAVLGGRVEEFTVTQSGDTPQAGGAVQLRVVLEVWSQGKGPLLARLPLQASAPFAALEPQLVAAAANEAMGRLLDDFSDRLEALRPVVLQARRAEAEPSAETAAIGQPGEQESAHE